MKFVQFYHMKQAFKSCIHMKNEKRKLSFTWIIKKLKKIPWFTLIPNVQNYSWYDIIYHSNLCCKL
jgi:hypothetical protein